MVLFRKRLTGAIVKLRLPVIVLYAPVSIPLIVFEEQIDCQTAWCGRVIIPPHTSLHLP
jgi:hypothetical protein